MKWPYGKVLTQSYDLDYRLSSKSVPGITDLSYGYTVRNNIASLTDGIDISKNQTFAYDKLQRLSDASGNYGVQNYTFDAIGNRLTKTNDGLVDTYAYATLNHHLQSVANSTTTTALSYDAVGNTLTKGDLTFTYNQTGRLTTANKVGMTASYLYNAQGQRVQKTVNGTNTLFHYDQVGQLIAETDDQGALIQEYIYLDGARLATVTAALPQEVITFVHTDHLGSPLALSDLLGAIQWQGSYDPYGTVTVEIDNVSQKLRFPGQYADAETGMHYNYFRDYDPEIGRYLQSDPIGLNGGMNTYGYVSGNPVANIDFFGLAGQTIKIKGTTTTVRIDNAAPNSSTSQVHAHVKQNGVKEIVINKDGTGSHKTNPRNLKNKKVWKFLTSKGFQKLFSFGFELAGTVTIEQLKKECDFGNINSCIILKEMGEEVPEHSRDFVDFLCNEPVEG